jgi:ABC-2 type transport system permease protein
MDILTVATLSERGVNALGAPIIIVFSGSLIPLPLLPEWMQPFLHFQPFAGLLDIPFRIYSGHLGGLEATVGLANQLVWSLVMMALGHLLMSRVMTRLQVQGG